MQEFLPQDSLVYFIARPEITKADLPYFVRGLLLIFEPS